MGIIHLTFLKNVGTGKVKRTKLDHVIKGLCPIDMNMVGLSVDNPNCNPNDHLALINCVRDGLVL